ncbi:MAG: type II toxin-antitoxin system prevent-host-death family antitoxin [Chromatiaceae bacterium]|jgi:prevent-host-death family protein|nr:type II toxin-antitoxin system prevent-host-death family antitoxin [Chromatiaceae bacterium]
MQTFSVRDLRDRTTEVVREAQSGKLSVVTKHGQPVFVAVPFDETLLREGVAVALAVKLFDDEAISLGKAAQLAGMSLSDFTDTLGRLGIPVARPISGELEQELETFG